MKRRDARRRRYGYITTAATVCAAFLAGSLLFLYYMTKSSLEEGRRTLADMAVQNRTSIVKQVQGDFQTLRGIAVALGEFGPGESGEADRVLRRINDGNAFLRMGLAAPDGFVDLVDLSGACYTGVDLSGETFFQRALAGEESLSASREDLLAPGTWVHYYAVPVYSASGTVEGVLCAVISTDLFRDIVDVPVMSGRGFSCILDAQGRFVVRSRHEKMTQADARTLAELGEIGPEDAQAVQRALAAGERVEFGFRIGNERGPAVLEPLGVNDWYVFSTVSERVLWGRYRLTVLGMAVIITAASGIFLFFLYQQRRMSARSESALRAVAYTDPLTGGGNRAKFLLDAQAWLESRGDGGWAVWYCDLKNFKYYNDIFGYQRGDEVLRALYGLLGDGAKGAAYRLSADNFAGMRAYGEKAELQAWFERLARRLAQGAHDHMSRLRVEICMGFYCVENAEARLSAQDMLNRANMAQKSAKRMPGSRCALFSEALRERTLWESELEAHFARGLEREEFQLYMQPKVDIQHGDRIAGAEVLVRWQYPGRGMLAPGEFIPLLERGGLIVELDRYMFEHACAWYRDNILPGGKKISLAVNVSRLGLVQEDFLRYYGSVKERYGIPDGVLELEFTESVLMNDDAVFAQLVCGLQKMGFICSMDDFGSGYSSLNVLKDLPLDVLKLDVMFFRRSRDMRRERIVIRNVIGLARQLHMRTIAEGVEFPEMVDFLRGAGCDVVQGYVFAKPMPAQQFAALLCRMEGKPMLPAAPL